MIQCHGLVRIMGPMGSKERCIVCRKLKKMKDSDLCWDCNDKGECMTCGNIHKDGKCPFESDSNEERRQMGFHNF